jgi:hypothetical protein
LGAAVKIMQDLCGYLTGVGHIKWFSVQGSTLCFGSFRALYCFWFLVSGSWMGLWPDIIKVMVDLLLF